MIFTNLSAVLALGLTRNCSDPAQGPVRQFSGKLQNMFLDIRIANRFVGGLVTLPESDGCHRFDVAARGRKTALNMKTVVLKRVQNARVRLVYGSRPKDAWEVSWIYALYIQ